MRLFLSENSALKWLETPAVFDFKTDELYELDDESFDLLKRCSSSDGCDINKDDFADYCLNEGILSAIKNSVKRPELIKSPVPSLRYLELQITDKCNLKCRHCYIESQKNNELSYEDIKIILSEFQNMQGLRLLITGGEPLLHKRFEDINWILPDFLFRKVLFTNGLLLNQKVLKGLNVEEIQISVDGLKNAHDSLRGKGSFKSAIKAIRLAADSGFEVSVSTMIHSRNLNDFEEMDSLFKGLGIKDWTVDIPCRTGRIEKNPEFFVNPASGGKYLNFGYSSGLHDSSPGFACGLHLACVNADGKISKCSFYSDKPSGTVKDGLLKSWKKIKPIRLQELECKCEHIDLCRGGCRYRAELSGNALGKDPYKCALYSAKD